MDVRDTITARDLAIWMLSRLAFSKRAIMAACSCDWGTVDKVVARLDALPAHEIVDACPIMRERGKVRLEEMRSAHEIVADYNALASEEPNDE